MKSLPLLLTRRNAYTNTDWSGGTTPTGWTAAGGTGTRTAAVSIVDRADNSIRFQATAQRPMLQQSVAVLAGDVWTVSFDVEAVGDVSTLTWGNFIGISGVTIAAANDWNGISLGGVDVIGTLGLTRVYARLTFTASGNCAFRIGPGVSGAATADVTISRPALFRGHRKQYKRVA